MAGGSTRQREGEPDITIAPEGPALQGKEAYRYHLKAPTFTGLEDVEQFFQEFKEVINLAQWPPRVVLIHLRRALMEQAKPYGLGTSVDGIFAALRAHFGISTIDARDRLQRVCRTPRTSLQEHAATVKSLAQIAYSDLPVQHQERYTYDAFVQSLNYLGLHHQLQVKGVTTVEGALRAGEAYLLATQLHKVQGSRPQAAINATKGYTVPLRPTQAAAAPTASPLDAEVNRMAGMFDPRSLQLHPTNTEASQPPRRPGTFSLPLTNRFHRLPEEEEPTTDLEPEGPVGSSYPLKHKPRPRGPRKPRAFSTKPYPGRTEHAGGEGTTT